MGTSRDEIRDWLVEGKKNGKTHCIIVCDEFSYEDYPVYVDLTQNVKKIYDKYCYKNMQRVMEVYNLNLDIHEQLMEYRAFHF